MLSQLLSNRVEKTPATEVSADRYQFLALSEAEPDLGVPAANGYLLSSTTTGTRSWIDPATSLTAPGTNTQVIFNNSGVLAGATGLVYDTATGRVGIGVTSPTSRLDIAETWNSSGTTFTGVKLNVTDTASNAASKLIDLQVGGSSMFNVTKTGKAVAVDFGQTIGGSGFYTNGIFSYANYFSAYAVTAGGGGVDSLERVRIRNSSLVLTDSAANNPVYVTRDRADILAQRNGTNPQTSRIYNTFTDASNYERATIGWNTNVLQIGTEAAGTGTLRNVNLIGNRVGVNVAVPATSLDIQGDYGSGLRVRGPIVDNNWYGGIQLTNSTGAASGAVISASTSGMFFNYGGSERARINSSGNFGINTITPSARLDVAGDIEVNSNVNLNSEATTLATTTQTQIASFAAASFRSAKLIVQAYDSVTGEVHISELLVAHNGTTASSTEYGVVYTGSAPLAVYDVDINSGNVRLLATRTTANSTQYKVSETLMVA